MSQAPPSQLDVRSVLTGMFLGAILSLCNIYSGLKIGWGFNMSIAACLLAAGFWRSSAYLLRTRPFGILENMINATGASAAASVASVGLVSSVPALTMLTGYEWHYPTLVLWIFVVCMVGVVVAVGMRKQFIVIAKLRFPFGLATAETLQQIHSVSSDATRRVLALIGAALLSAAVKLVVHWRSIAALALPGSYAAPSTVAAHGVARVTMRNLTFALDPTLMMPAFGVLVGFRAAASMLLGSAIAWGIVAPYVLEQGWIAPGAEAVPWFNDSLKWLLWPGVAMMVSSSLTSFAFSWRSIFAALLPEKVRVPVDDPAAAHDVPRRFFFVALIVALAIAVIAQVVLFDVRWWTATIGVALTFVLAIVAGRVTGETNVTPVGPMGKVTQLLFGLLEPGRAASNLMAATVTGGAAAQCGDLLHDMKAGAIVGASPRSQAIAQSFGALAGALMGSAGYLLLLPDPAHQIGTPEFPAPAVLAWKAVAEIFMRGVGAMPPGALAAMAIGGTVGVVLACLERLLPKRIARFVPSPASVGIAFIVPASNAIGIFAGAAVAAIAERVNKKWSDAYVMVIAAGLVAGESLAGMTLALVRALGG